MDLEKIPAKAIEKVVDGVCGAIGAIFNPAARELGSIMGDQMKFWRFQNGLRILSRAEEVIEERGLKKEQLLSLPYGEQFLLLEKATLEDKDEVQEMWSQLIANALDPNSEIEIEKKILNLLSSISPAEAGLLLVLKKASKKSTFQTQDEVEEFSKEIGKLADVHWRLHPKGVRQSCVQNLIRLRCIGIRPSQLNAGGMFATLPSEILEGAWSDRWSLIDPEKFERLINQLSMNVSINAGIQGIQEQAAIPLMSQGAMGGRWGLLPVREMNYVLTPLGEELVSSCITDVSE